MASSAFVQVAATRAAAEDAYHIARKGKLCHEVLD